MLVSVGPVVFIHEAVEFRFRPKRATSVVKQLALEGLRAQLDEMVPLVRQVTKQTRARIFRGSVPRSNSPVSCNLPTSFWRARMVRSRIMYKHDSDGASGVNPKFVQACRSSLSSGFWHR